MQPALLIVLNKVRQEARRRARACRIRRASGIVQFRKVRRQLAAVELRQRQTPERFILLRGTRQQATGKRIVKTEQRVIIITQRSFRRPGEGRRINDQFRFLRTGINQAIGQHQTPFGISVHHFNFFTVAIGNNIAQFERVAADQVIRTAEEQLHALVQSARNGKCQRPGNRCRAAHVRLHRVHKRSLFDAVAAGVKSDTFTYQARVHWRFFIACWVVIQRQQYRGTF